MVRIVEKVRVCLAEARMDSATRYLGTHQEAREYNQSERHRWDKGDLLVLVSDKIVGFGHRPVAQVLNYFVDYHDPFGPEGKYQVIISHEEAKVINSRRVQEIHNYSKWDMENLFMLAPSGFIWNELILNEHLRNS